MTLPPGQEKKRVARVVLLPASAIVEEGRNVVFIAQAYNSANQPLSGKRYDTPTTTNPAYVKVTVTGNQLIAHGVFEGNADVSCSCEGVRAPARTVVVQPSVPLPAHFDPSHFDSLHFAEPNFW